MKTESENSAETKCEYSQSLNDRFKPNVSKARAVY